MNSFNFSLKILILFCFQFLDYAVALDFDFDFEKLAIGIKRTIASVDHVNNKSYVLDKNNYRALFRCDKNYNFDKKFDVYDQTTSWILEHLQSQENSNYYNIILNISKINVSYGDFKEIKKFGLFGPKIITRNTTSTKAIGSSVSQDILVEIFSLTDLENPPLTILIGNSKLLNLDEKDLSDFILHLEKRDFFKDAYKIY